jgi:hypothetical protein
VVVLGVVLIVLHYGSIALSVVVAAGTALALARPAGLDRLVIVGAGAYCANLLAQIGFYVDLVDFRRRQPDAFVVDWEPYTGIVAYELNVLVPAGVLTALACTVLILRGAMPKRSSRLSVALMATFVLGVLLFDSLVFARWLGVPLRETIWWMEVACSLQGYIRCSVPALACRHQPGRGTRPGWSRTWPERNGVRLHGGTE